MEGEKKVKKNCLIVLILTLVTFGLFSQKFPTDMKNNGTEEEIQNIQEMLVELGYGPITVNGIYGDDTVSAVLEFKKDFSFLKDDYSEVFTEDDYIALINDSELMLGYKECIKKINEIRSGKLKKDKKEAYDDNGFSSDSATIYTESIKGKKVKCVLEVVYPDMPSMFMSWTVYPIEDNVFVYQFHIDCDSITAWISYYCVDGTMYEINGGNFIEEIDYYKQVKDLLFDMYERTQN